ncbi:nucleoside phosphorylase [Candidatus Aenigmatarchaeota archaeon]
MTFPNLQGKHDGDSLTTPEEFLRYMSKRKGFSAAEEAMKKVEGMIFCYDKRLLKYILKTHDVREIKDPYDDPYFHGKLYLLKECDEKIGILTNFGIGSPIAAALMDEMITFGIKKFISIGTAGTLQKHIKIGSIVVCDKAIRDEGTSHHYIKPEKYVSASSKMIEKIKESLEKNDLEYNVGTTWTIDAPYRETIAEVKQYQKEGVLTVEMEASAIFSVGIYKNVDVGAIFTISDCLADLVWNPQLDIGRKNLEKIFKVAKEVLMN